MTSDRTLRRWYNQIALDFFREGEMPPNHKVCLRWATSKEEPDCASTAPPGMSHPTRYVLLFNRSNNPTLSILLSAMVHEMIHVAEIHAGDQCDHEGSFERWRIVLGDRGIFRKGAVRKNLTLF